MISKELKQKIYDLYIRDIITDFGDFRINTYWDYQYVYDFADDGTATNMIAVIHIFKVPEFSRYDVYIVADEKLAELKMATKSDNPARVLNYLKYNKWVNSPKKSPDKWVPEMSGQAPQY